MMTFWLESKARAAVAGPARGRGTACAALVAVLLLVPGCGPGGGAPPAEPAVEVLVAKPERMVVEDLVSAVGTLEADEQVTLSAESPGLVEAIRFTEGERVRQGQTLFELDARKEQAALAQAEAEAALARSNLERARPLAGTRAISQQELEQLESQLAVKEATARVEKERLADRSILAPFDGWMGPRLVSPGQYVSPGAPLGVLVEDRQVKARFRIPERQLSTVQLGQPGRLRVNAYPDRVFTGLVDLIDPVVDESTRTVEIRLRTDNPDRVLRPGMFARGELVVGRRDQALVVPESGLIAALDAFCVYVVDEGRARLQRVQIGVRLPGKVEVREGLTPDAEVVVRGTQKIVDGTRVATRLAAVAETTGSAAAAGAGGAAAP